MSHKEVEVASLKQFVAYQEGSIVSKEILRKEKGTVSVFAFDRGQGLSEHTAPFDALVIVLDGTAEVRVAGIPHTVKAGEMVVMPANQPHSLQAVERFKMMLTLIRS